MGYFSRSFGLRASLRFSTMGIREELETELKEALKAKDQPRKDAIRSVQTEVSRAKAEPGFEGEADDGLYQKVIAAYVKRMQKATEEYRSLGERGDDMATKLEFETSYLGRWLPQTLGENETLAVVDAAIAQVGASSSRDAGRVIGEVMRNHKGAVDGSLVNKLVRQQLGD